MSGFWRGPEESCAARWCTADCRVGRLQHVVHQGTLHLLHFASSTYCARCHHIGTFSTSCILNNVSCPPLQAATS